MAIMMITQTEAPTDEQYINAMSKHLKESSSDESIGILSTLVYCAKVLKPDDDTEGVKKECATDLKVALGVTKGTYKGLAEQFVAAIKDGKAAELVMPFMASNEPEQPEVDELDDIVEDDVVEDVDTNPVGMTEEMVRAIINDATASLMKNIRREIGKIANTTPVAKATPTPTKPTEQPKVEEEVADVGGLTIRKRTGRTPTGWKDAVNYSVAVVYDQVDKGQQVAIVKGLTAEDATTSGRNSIRRHLIRAFDVSNGNRNLNKATQDRETWVDVASASGITDAVCDVFLTNPNKYVQQSRRTGVTRRAKLGITDTDSFVTVVSDNMGSAPSVDESTPDLFAPTPASPVIATVSPDDIKALMSDSGMTYVDARAFLSA